VKTVTLLAFGSMFLVLALVGTVQAADGSSIEQFLGSPLLILAALLIIAGLATLYHGIRK
jgi:hypothetical protein